jgi:hypothetical protein
VPDPNSNRIVWREGAQGSSSFIRGPIEYRLLRYEGKIVRADLQLWGSNIVAYVEVTNDNAYTIDTAHDISVQLTLPRRDVLLPLETEQIARLLVKQSKANKDIAAKLRKEPWKLGPETIKGKSKWEGISYFAFRGQLADRFIKQVDLQVYFGGVAFVFPFKL